MKLIPPILICLLSTFVSLRSQSLGSFPDGLGIEVGGGHNQLKWHINPHPPFVAEQEKTRQEFSFTPTFRLSYQVSIFDEIRAGLFLGFNRFGGRSIQEPNGYKDEFWIDAIDIGVFTTYTVGYIAFGGGLKHNRHLRMLTRYYGSYNQTTPRSWEEHEDNIFFKNSSTNAGVRLSFILAPWSVSGESWFGITQLEKAEFDKLLNIRENHFRILLGYRL
ncbi:MAG: hypothetical protein KJ666_11080 [Bacteroidetes bacterium]|nr:hypothetical protein [Bacteroidota bacterium]